MEPPSVKEIDQAAESYVEARDARMAMAKTETERHDALLELMKKHSLPFYKFDGRTVRLNQTTKVSVKRDKDGDEDGEGDADDDEKPKRRGRKAPHEQDDSWRSTLVRDAFGEDFSKAIIEKLADAKVDMLGDLVDMCKQGRSALTNIKGIGPAAAEAIEQAWDAWRERRSAANGVVSEVAEATKA